MEEYKIRGFVARDSTRGDESDLYIGTNKPHRQNCVDDDSYATHIKWVGFGEFMAIPSSMFPDLNPTDEPIEVEITIKKKTTEL